MAPKFIFGDYQLPTALDQARAQRKIHLAIQFALNWTLNPRNLEYFWYGFGSRLAHDLAASQTRLLVIPQFYLWARKSDTGSAAQRASGWVDPDASLISNAPSIHEKPGPQCLPDFAIVFTPFAVIPGNFPRRWESLKLARGASVPVLMEHKCRPRRSETKGGLAKALILALDKAGDALLVQASILFKRYKSQNSVLLIELSGEYWSYGLYTRLSPNVPLFEGLDALKKVDDDSDQWEDPALDEAVREAQDDAENIEDDGASEDGAETDDPLDTLDQYYDQRFERAYRTEDSLRSAWPLNKWSGILEFGTSASNQQLHAIKLWLDNVVETNKPVQQPANKSVQQSANKTAGKKGRFRVWHLP